MAWNLIYNDCDGVGYGSAMASGRAFSLEVSGTADCGCTLSGFPPTGGPIKCFNLYVPEKIGPGYEPACDAICDMYEGTWLLDWDLGGTTTPGIYDWETERKPTGQGTGSNAGSPDCDIYGVFDPEDPFPHDPVTFLWWTMRCQIMQILGVDNYRLSVAFHAASENTSGGAEIGSWSSDWTTETQVCDPDTNPVIELSAKAPAVYGNSICLPFLTYTGTEAGTPLGVYPEHLYVEGVPCNL